MTTPPAASCPAASCPSTFTLDRYSVGELTADEVRALEGHLTGCASCRARQAELMQFSADFSVPGPAGSLTNHAAVVAPLHSVPARTKRRAASASVVAAVGALAAMFFLWFFPAPQKAEVRTKGGVRLGYHVSRGGAVWLAGPDEELHQNDVIQFILSAPEPGFVAVFSVDGQGQVSSYYPAEGATAAAYTPEQSRLSTSTVLDEALGSEVFVAVFCPHPFRKDAVIQSLEKVKASPEHLRFPDCSIETLHAKKVRR